MHGSVMHERVGDRRPGDWQVEFDELELQGASEDPATRRAAVELFRRYGMFWRAEGIDQALVDRCRDASQERLTRCLGEISRRGLPAIERGTANGYAEIVARAHGRYDMLYGTDSDPFDRPEIRANSSWMPLVEALLGGQASLLFCGLLMTMGGASEQLWHADGEHLFGPEVPIQPPHCLNVFIPLVDIYPEIGGTELCPGSHHLTRGISEIYEQSSDFVERIGWQGRPIAPSMPAGSALLFDYRLLHRGLANRTEMLRPILYLTFCRRWFRDTHNFPARQLFLPPSPRR